MVSAFIQRIMQVALVSTFGRILSNLEDTLTQKFPQSKIKFKIKTTKEYHEQIWSNPADNYILKVNNRNTKTSGEIFQRWCFSNGYPSR